jgi:hypothetical protein
MTEAEEQANDANRCVIVVASDLPSGRAANAAAVIALTIGRLRPDLVGTDLVDLSGVAHHGLIPIGISVLAAPMSELAAVRTKALAKEMLMVDFPVQGQQTNDYSAFSAAVGDRATEELSYVGIGLVGSRKAVGKIVGRYSLLK